MGSPTTRNRLAALINGSSLTQAIACAASLEIADKLAAGPRTTTELAVLAKCSATHLERLMRFLCNAGVFSERPEGYVLTGTSEYLRRDREDSLWPLAVFHGDEMHRALGGLLDNVRTGVPAWHTVMGSSLWDYLSMNPERAAIFDRLMRVNHHDNVEGMVRAYDFSAARVVVDVGGGDGSLLREILTRNPALSGILFDAPDVVTRARANEAWAASGARCQFVGGDFFEDVPPHGDVYVLRHVLHDWDDDLCVRLLRCCRRAMSEDARLLVIESLLDSERDAGIASVFDLSMMIIAGQERSSEEYKRLLGRAGYEVTRLIPSAANVSLIEARPAPANSCHMA